VTVAAIFSPRSNARKRRAKTIFGEAYDEYRRAPRRYGPRLTAWRDAATLEISPARLYRTIADGLVFARSYRSSN